MKKSIEMIIAAGHSGSGKTMITLALLEYLNRRGYDPVAFKCGPDYIDPMYHRSIDGVESHNLDLYLSDPDTVKSLYQLYSTGHNAVVIEGVMGINDGVGGTAWASTSDLSKVLSVPILYVINADEVSDDKERINGEGDSEWLFTAEDKTKISAVFINKCEEKDYEGLKKYIEEEYHLSVIGYLPQTEYASLGSRHLGLIRASEYHDLKERISHIADMISDTFDAGSFERIFKGRHDAHIYRANDSGSKDKKTDSIRKDIRLAIAKDEAFCFLYEESLDVLRDEGVELIFFSPIHDKSLPRGISGLYLPGGYPELYAEALSKNIEMKKEISDAVLGGIPTIAECGGFIYLGSSMEADGIEYEMCGVLKGSAKMSGHLIRFGYAQLTAVSDGMLLKKGENTGIHEFHYYESDHNGNDAHLIKPVSKKNWDECINTQTMYAGFPHLYMAGDTRLAKRFAGAMRVYNAATRVKG